MVRAHLEFGELPWKHAAISGWILDPDRKKMSKSKGNVVTPMGLLEKHGSDAVRYWAASARLGTDAAFDEQQMKIGRRLAMKILNASKFALGMAGGEAPVDLDVAAVTEPLDKAMLAMLADVVDRATKALEGYDHTRALELTETCFWTFCDDYLELVKNRAYDRDGEYAAAGEADKVRSARVALNLAVDTFLRLLAPILPYATEEVWSWYRTGSVHRASWPVASELGTGGDASLVGIAGAVLAALRKVKSEQKVSQRTAFANVTLEVPADSLASVELVRAEVEAAAHVEGQLVFVPTHANEPAVNSFEFTL